MMKSYANFYLGLYGAILEDIADWYPSLRESLMLDKARLLSLVEARGLSFLTIDLPELGKHFEQCLAKCLFTTPSLPGSRPKKRRGGIIPRLFAEIYLRVFDEFGVLRNDADVNAIRALRQLFYTAKKAKLECKHERIQQAIAEFFSIERELPIATGNWNDDEFRQADDHLVHFERVGRPTASDWLPFSEEKVIEPTDDSTDWGLMPSIQLVCDIISSQIGVFDPLQWRTKHGPGAVAELRSGTSKYEFPSYPRKLDNVFPLADFAFANYAQWADDVSREDGHRGRFSLHEPPSRLLAVPKTQKAPRLIAAEPVAHQWAQQSVKDFLTERVRASSIRRTVHFRDQGFNRRLALTASQSRSHWTIDLSSASDRVSCWHAERAFRRNKTLLSALHACRTRWVVTSIDGVPRDFHVLRKLSTMGSAVTFPVQTILFACIAIGAILHSRKIPVSIKSIEAVSREVRVFGDDILVPDDGGLPVLGALGDLGFKVNRNKTFGSGNFRESCGMDAYNGADVAPVYTSSYPEKSRLESLVSSIAVRNNFYRSCYYNAADYIESMVMRAAPWLKVPSVSHDSGVLGWITNGVPNNSHLRSRACYVTHQRTFLYHTLTSKMKKGPDRHTSRLLQWFTESPDPHVQWESGVPGRPKLLLKLRWEGLGGVYQDPYLRRFV